MLRQLAVPAALVGADILVRMTATPVDLNLPQGEHVLWSGAPDPAKVFTRNDVFLVPFSLLWGGFAVYWTVGVSVSRAPVFFVIFGLAFAVFGLYFVVGRFFVKAAMKRETAYVLTNRVRSCGAAAPRRRRRCPHSRRRPTPHGTVDT
jgi:hypothetical protein